MSIKRLYLFLLLISSSVAISQNNSSLISAQELFENLTSVRVIDVSNEDQFNESNIFSSVNVSRSDFTDNTGEFGGLIANKSSVEGLLSNLGITNETNIVLYDHKGGCDATRLWWILKVYGHEKAQILDGGLNTWGDKNELISPWIIDYQKTNYTFENPRNEEIFADINDVKAAMDDPETILLDTRTIEEYEGEIMKEGAFRSGRIPGSIHMDWASAIDYDGNQELKTNEELLSLYENAGITKDKNIIVYCQSGARSTHNSFVLTQILGYPNVSNYDGSWIEWSYHSELPIESGAVEEITAEDELMLSSENSIQETGGRASYGEVFWASFGSYWAYVWSEITLSTEKWYVNYFWWLIVLSLVVWGLEVAFPWRKDQPLIRKDFWLDAFYMFFNFYIFKIVIFMAFSNITAMAFSDLFGGDIKSLVLFDMSVYAWWIQLLVFFVATDFIQWFTHVLLHRFNFLWKFHKVHHSVEQMGFAAHLRFHWMENVFYTPMKYLTVLFIGGFDPEYAFVVYYFAIAVGHLNHANINLSYGPLKYIFNSAKMHIWHHAHDLPKDKRHGVNFGITLSIWDYIFRTNYIPSDGRDIKLGFEGLEEYPKTFWRQLVSGFRKKD